MLKKRRFGSVYWAEVARRLVLLTGWPPAGAVSAAGGVRYAAWDSMRTMRMRLKAAPASAAQSWFLASPM